MPWWSQTMLCPWRLQLRETATQKGDAFFAAVLMTWWCDDHCLWMSHLVGAVCEVSGSGSRLRISTQMNGPNFVEMLHPRRIIRFFQGQKASKRFFTTNTPLNTYNETTGWSGDWRLQRLSIIWCKAFSSSSVMMVIDFGELSDRFEAVMVGKWTDDLRMRKSTFVHMYIYIYIYISMYIYIYDMLYKIHVQN